MICGLNVKETKPSVVPRKFEIPFTCWGKYHTDTGIQFRFRQKKRKKILLIRTIIIHDIP